MSDVYRFFASDAKSADFSEASALAMFESESTGKPLPNWEKNGFAVGKHWMNVTLTQWKKDIADGIITARELYEDASLSPVKAWVQSVIEKPTPRGDARPLVKLYEGMIP